MVFRQTGVEGDAFVGIGDPAQVVGDLQFRRLGRLSQPTGIVVQRLSFHRDPGSRMSRGMQHQRFVDIDHGERTLRGADLDGLAVSVPRDVDGRRLAGAAGKQGDTPECQEQRTAVLGKHSMNPTDRPRRPYHQPRLSVSRRPVWTRISCSGDTGRQRGERMPENDTPPDRPQNLSVAEARQRLEQGNRRYCAAR